MTERPDRWFKYDNPDDSAAPPAPILISLKVAPFHRPNTTRPRRVFGRSRSDGACVFNHALEIEGAEKVEEFAARRSEPKPVVDLPQCSAVPSFTSTDLETLSESPRFGAVPSLSSTASRASSTSSRSTVTCGTSCEVGHSPDGLDAQRGRRFGKVGAKLGPIFRSMGAVHSLRGAAPKPEGQRLAPPFQPENAVIILDWDDTLIATTYIQHSVFPARPEHPLDRPVPVDPRHYDSFLSHARVVEQVLRKARAVARVAIVTLASKFWFELSLASFLPGIDLVALLQELDIQVFHADRQSSLARHLAQGGSDPCLVAKRTAMTHCLKQMYSGSTAQWNVLSIGDSLVEREALKECLKKESKNGPALCKTLKIRSRPTLKQLTDELKQVLPRLQPLVASERSFDKCANGSDARVEKAGLRRAASMPLH